MAVPNGEDEILALEQFRTKVEDLSLGDGVLMRFLRARNLDLSKSEEMLRTSVAWRKTNVYELQMKDWKPEKEFMLKFEVFTTGFDDHGRQVFYLIVDNWFPARQLFDDFEPQDFIMFAYRSLNLIYKQLLETQNQQIVAILDNDGVGFSKIFYEVQNWTGLQTLIDIWTIYEANYPETLNKAFLINTARAFMWGFNLVKPFMTKHTLSKISIYGSDESKWKPDLHQYLPSNVIPIKYGGTADTQHLYDLLYDGAMQKII